MPDIKVTDSVTINPAFELRDDAPLAHAGLNQLIPSTQDFVASLKQPLDKIQVKSIALGAKFSTPDVLSDDATSLTFPSGVNLSLSLATHDDGTLFADDKFSPSIEIGKDDVWVGVELDSIVKATAKASANGLGISATVATAAKLATYTLVHGTVDAGFPSLGDALGTAFRDFTVLLTADAVLNQPPGTVCVSDLNGSVTVGASASLPLPFDLNAFASADLPLDTTVAVAPTVTVAVAASLKLEGGLIVRSYRIAPNLCQIGVYRKRGETLKLSLDAAAGVEGDLNDTDLIGPLLNKAFGADQYAAAVIPADRQAELNGVMQDAVDRSLSIALNASFSSSNQHEAAVLYNLRLDTGDPAATKAALQAALHGDWTKLCELPNAEQVRNLVVQTTSRRGLFQINLLGFYTAASISQYLKTCTFLVDEHGDLTITDQISAKNISVAGMPYEADRDKLRRAVIDSFLATAVYKLVKSKLAVDIQMTLSYFDYAKTMPRDRMRRNLLLAYALGVPRNSLDSSLDDPHWLDHVSFSAVVKFGNADLMRVFYKDPTLRTQWSEQELTQLARQTMLALIWPETVVEEARIQALSKYWDELESRPAGNYTGSTVLPQIVKDQGIRVHTDWFEIKMWVASIRTVGGALTELFAAIDAASGANPLADAQVDKKRKQLANSLGSLAKKSAGSFTHGWGESMQFALGGRNATVTVDIEVEAAKRHFERAALA